MLSRDKSDFIKKAKLFITRNPGSISLVSAMTAVVAPVIIFFLIDLCSTENNATFYAILFYFLISQLLFLAAVVMGVIGLILRRPKKPWAALVGIFIGVIFLWLVWWGADWTLY